MPYKCVLRRRFVFPVFNNFSETHCMKVSLDVRIFLLRLGGGKKLPLPLPPPPKNSFSWNNIKSYFKYWSPLTTILRNQWRVLMSRNAISANPEHYLFKIFWGSMPPDSPKRPKKFFLPLRGSKIDFPFKQRILDWTMLVWWLRSVFQQVRDPIFYLLRTAF